VEGATTDGLSEFVRHHNTKGQRSKDVQNATDAILTAACFALPADNDASLRQLSLRILGKNDAAGKLTYHKNKVPEMIGSGLSFAPMQSLQTGLMCLAWSH
jgi:hypothetical protein